MATPALDIQNFYIDSLKSTLSPTTVTISLHSVPTAAEGYLVISPDDPVKKEIIYYTSVNQGAGTVTCPSAALGRGIGGTTAQSHDAGEPVKQNIVAEYWRDLKTLVASESLTLIYPVGSLYITTLATNPATLLGFGTWAEFGAGRVLVGQNTGDTDFDVLEEVGGGKTHSHSGSFGSGGISANHTHGVTAYKGTATTYNEFASQSSAPSVWLNTSTVSSDHAHTTTVSFGSGTANSTVQPYIVVKMWKRIA